MKPVGPCIKRADCQVRTIPLSDLRSLVEEHHYAKGGANTATFRHGLFWRGNLVGGAWWIPPTKAAALASYPERWEAVICLSRLVVSPEVPANAASLLLSASVKLIKQDARWHYALTYADGWRGHKGRIYDACGWDYTGMTAPSSVYTDASGRMMGRKRGPKTFRHSEMIAAGFTLQGRFSKRRFGLLLRRPGDKT